MRAIGRFAIGVVVVAALAATATVAASGAPIDPKHPVIRVGAPDNAVRHLGPRVERTDEGYIEMPRPIDPPNRPHLTFKIVGASAGGAAPTGGALPSSRGSASGSSQEDAGRQVRDVIRKLG